MNLKQKEELEELNKISHYGEQYECISLIADCLESEMERNENSPEGYKNYAKANRYFSKLVDLVYESSTFKTITEQN